MKTLTGMESYCIEEYTKALEVILYTLAENTLASFQSAQ